MRDLGTTWSNIVESGEFQMDTVAVINNVEYSTITAPVIESKLLASDTLTIGNCVASVLTFTVKTNDHIPKASKVIIKSRVKNDNSISDWVEFGTFWINARTVDDDSNLIDLTCYDAMVRGHQQYDDDTPGVNWPKPITTVVSRIATQMGVTVDSRTTSYISNSSTGITGNVVTKPNDDEELLDVLSKLGNMLGGNWIVTPENKLRFVPVASSVDGDTYNVIDENGNDILTDDGYNLVHHIGSGAGQDVPGIDSCTVPIVLGGISSGRRFSISRVTMDMGDDTYATLGTDSDFELSVGYCPFATQALFNKLFQKLDSVEYLPYNVTGAIYDPAVELGDRIIITGRVYGVLYCEKRTFGINFSGDISAPSNEETTNEFGYVSQIDRQERIVRELSNNFESRIEQNNEEIILTVAETYGQPSRSVSGNPNMLRDTNSFRMEHVYGDYDKTFTLFDYVNPGITSTWEALSNYEWMPEPPTSEIEYGAIMKTNATVSANNEGYARIVLYGMKNPDAGSVDAWPVLPSGSISVTAGNTYTLSCYACAYGGSFPSRVTAYIRYTQDTGEGHVYDSDILRDANGYPLNCSVYSNSGWGRLVWTFVASEDWGGQIDVQFIMATYSPNSYTVFCGFKLEEGSEATDWNDGPLILSTVDKVYSQIYQSSDTIRLQAAKLMWKSDHSSMTEDGTLSIGRARITNNWSGVDGGEGLLLGKSQIIGLMGSEAVFGITLPGAESISGYIDIDYSQTGSDGEEMEVFDLIDCPVAEVDSIYFWEYEDDRAAYADEESIKINVGGSYGLTLGANDEPRIKIASDGTIFINTPSLCVCDPTVYGAIYHGMTGTVNGIRFLNGIAVEPY